MSRINADECCTIDMEWYGIDKKGNIAVFCSGGCGNLPEFVCENKERADEIIEYFDNIEKNTESTLIFKLPKLAEQVIKDSADKGLWYFDTDDGSRYNYSTNQEYYTKHAFPNKPLKYENLPEHIKKLLKYNFLDIENFSNKNTISVEHAYKREDIKSEKNYIVCEKTNILKRIFNKF